MRPLAQINGSVASSTFRRLHAGIGSSEAADAASAGREAAEQAVRRLGTAPPALVMVLASVRYDLPLLLAGIREVTGTAPLVGATSSGHFHEGQLTPPGTGVTVLVLTGDRYKFGVAAVTGVRGGAFAAGQALARRSRAAADAQECRHAAMLVLVDGLAGAQQTLVNGIYRVTGAPVPVVGGAAADDRRLAETFVFHGAEVLTDAAVAVWIGSDRPVKVVRGHGWRPVGLPMLVTRVEDTVVHEIAGRPAREVFEEHFRVAGPLHKMVWEMPGGHYSAGAFGLIAPDGALLIRGAFIDSDGGIRTFAPLPAYSAVQLVASHQDDLLDVADRLVSDALSGSDDPAVLLGFSCVARLDILLGRSFEEAARLQAAAGSLPTFGFYTYGEFARTTGVAGYHNATIAAVAL